MVRRKDRRLVNHVGTWKVRGVGSWLAGEVDIILYTHVSFWRSIYDSGIFFLEGEYSAMLGSSAQFQKDLYLLIPQIEYNHSPRSNLLSNKTKDWTLSSYSSQYLSKNTPNILHISSTCDAINLPILVFYFPSYPSFTSPHPSIPFAPHSLTNHHHHPHNHIVFTISHVYICPRLDDIFIETHNRSCRWYLHVLR